METMFAAGRRSLPPVPRPAADRPAGRTLPSDPPQPRAGEMTEPATDELATQNTGAETPSDDTSQDGTQQDGTPQDGISPESDSPDREGDGGQQFVARLRSAAADFASAAGARTAVVREAVPPARHRRSRCRLVLRYGDGHERDLTFLGPVERPGSEAPFGFDAAIQRWLGSGQRRAPEWLVPDDDAEAGVAVDVTAWLAAG